MSASTTIRMQEGVPYAETMIFGQDGVTPATTGYTAALRVARRGVLVFALAEGDGITTTEGTDEVSVVLAVSAVRAAMLGSSKYKYELDLLKDGSPACRVNGVVEVQASLVTG
jgi:uncharacterized lipoprotein YbaY